MIQYQLDCAAVSYILSGHPYETPEIVHHPNASTDSAVKSQATTFLVLSYMIIIILTLAPHVVKIEVHGVISSLAFDCRPFSLLLFPNLEHDLDSDKQAHARRDYEKRS